MITGVGEIDGAVVFAVDVPADRAEIHNKTKTGMDKNAREHNQPGFSDCRVSNVTPYGFSRASGPERLANRFGNIGLPRGAYRGEPNQLNAKNGNVQSFASHICHETVLETPQRDCEWLIIEYC